MRNTARKEKNQIRLEELTAAFLLFSYSKKTTMQKKKLNIENVPEIVFRTTKIEEPWITRNDISQALKDERK